MYLCFQFCRWVHSSSTSIITYYHVFYCTFLGAFLWPSSATEGPFRSVLKVPTDRSNPETRVIQLLPMYEKAWKCIFSSHSLPFLTPPISGNRFFEVEVNLRRKTTQPRIQGLNSPINGINVVNLHYIDICEAFFHLRRLSTSKAERTCFRPKRNFGVQADSSRQYSIGFKDSREIDDNMLFESPVTIFPSR